MIEATSEALRRPELPGPKLTRWQPLRLGLVELFRYDSEEFWFRDGHLLLRGNNGTGKSKVLALTLPFLFDARLTAARLEPDGDPGKKMAWNLLLGSYERRTGYAWIEFGRVRADGSPQFLTLGAGLSAMAARTQVESWYFVADGPRIGENLWLTTAQRGVLPRERLRDAIAGVGQLFDNAKDYRRAVDERLFRLGTTRYEALMDTLVHLRQPQLSKRPDETNLSNALTESLPPLATDMLGDVAEALNRLEDDRRQLEEYQELERAVARFEQRYRLYAGTQSRRQARRVRQAQTEFDNASRPFNEAQDRLTAARVDELRAQAARDEAALELGVACGHDDPGSTEAWIAPDGRFRLGALSGAWTKPAAVYIGFVARAAARVRRLASIAERRTELAAQRVELEARVTLQSQAESAAEDEWRRAPSDDPLRTAHATARACAREFVVARDRLAQAEARFAEIDRLVQTARRDLSDAATDLQLPQTADALLTIEAEIDRFSRTTQTLAQAASGVRAIWPERAERQSRAAEATADRTTREQQLGIAQREAHEAAARWEVLRDAVGASVRELEVRLAEAAAAVASAQRVAEQAESSVRTTGEARAVGVVDSANADGLLQLSTERRAAAVRGLQTFAATGLLAVALAESGSSDLPDLRIAWTIDPALSLARRTEQILAAVDDSDEAWRRIQQRISEDFTELQRALSALGQQVQGETNDYGLVVHIVYQNRPESPVQLAKKLAAEIAQRRELLSATEREVLENHLQAEIATEVQRLLVAAEKQVEAINAELHKRPTSTGVRYRLQWLPLAEGADGAPVGLEAARKRLLNTSSDLWSAEDRRVVGALLQQRIAAERERADIAGSSSLTDQLARALDYRRWHHFRVQRWQDGQWRKLSGPASSGERALGLTVPLFAAVASFYTQSGYSDSPRLVLLDEAFAGIDAAARAHCMALIREFDLDFVITSESEWACYAELPGVAICQLQRREGVDAVLVSRWTWDGRARRPEDDPNRRFAPT